jgi:hypothetical protein
MKESRKKGFQIRLTVDERGWLKRVADHLSLTPASFLRSVIKKEYQALQRAERESAGLEKDDMIILKAVSDSECPMDRAEMGEQFPWVPARKLRREIARRVRRLKSGGYIRRVGRFYTLTPKGYATVPICQEGG